MSDGRVVLLLECLGRGSSGLVYRGLVESGWGVRKTVAVKVFFTNAELDHGEVMRCLGEIARRAACVRHASVVEVFEVDRTDSPAGIPQPFLVTEHVEGESLASLVDGWRARGLRPPTDFSVVVALRIAEGLGAAFFADCPDGSMATLVHGDLSPRQVLVSEHGEVKVCDFGQAALRGLFSHVRSRSALAYSAPEVACGSEPDPRSDVFSLGVILHELLLGPRFAPGTDFATATQMVRDGHFHVNALEPNLPRSLRDVVARALERNPRDRYPHARALAFDLRREMLNLGLSDAQTSVRHAVVGWCEVQADSERLRSDVVPKLDDVTAADTRRAKMKLGGS